MEGQEIEKKQERNEEYFFGNKEMKDAIDSMFKSPAEWNLLGDDE